MPNITGGEILIILLVALIILGPNRLPEAARTVSKATREFRKVQTSVHSEIRSTIDEVTRPVTETAAAMQSSIDQTVKDVSPGGPGTHVDADRRPSPPVADDPSTDTGPDAAGPPAPAAPASGTAVFTPGTVGSDRVIVASSGTAVFTPRDPATPDTSPRPVDDWGEADLYDDAR
jgi:sec-independent protein translocase protein TatB